MSFQIWNHYDADKKGYLERQQLRVSCRSLFDCLIMRNFLKDQYVSVSKRLFS